MLRVTNLIGFGGRRGAALTPVVWNSADKTAGVTLSNGNKTATATNVSSDQGARGNIGKSAGKWYFEMHTATALWESNTSRVCMGIAQAGFTLGATEIGRDSSSLSIGPAFNWDRVYFDNSSTNLTAPPDDDETNVGDVVMFAVDFDAQSFWAGLDGSWAGVSVAGNPAAGTNPIVSSFGAATWYPALSAGNQLNAAVTLAASAADCAHSLPAGFEYWGE